MLQKNVYFISPLPRWEAQERNDHRNDEEKTENLLSEVEDRRKLTFVCLFL